MTNEACFQPINGISLERYADLGAAIADANDDQAKIAEIIKAEGVALDDWNAAKNGWTARMQDMSLMGRVATAFIPGGAREEARRQGDRELRRLRRRQRGDQGVRIRGRAEGVQGLVARLDGDRRSLDVDDGRSNDGVRRSLGRHRA